MLDFNVEDNCPLNMIVTDRFQMKNEGNTDIQFQILVPNSTVYLIDFDYRAGVIPKVSFDPQRLTN